MDEASESSRPNVVKHYLDRENIEQRTFVFDPESLRANHRQVLVNATEGTERYACFVIMLDEGATNDEASDAEHDSGLFVFRAHRASPNTEVIVGALREEPMRALVRRILRQDPNEGIPLEVATYPEPEADG